MIKTLKNVFKRDKEKFAIPKSVQDTIPVQTVYSDGIFKVGYNKFSKTFKFADINYAVSSDEDKKTIFLAYEELLNSFDSTATTKITVNNRKLNKEEFEKEILLENQDDGLDYLRKEYNEMLKTKVTAANALIQEKYITISINKKTVEDARTYFNRVGSELSSRFARLESVCVPIELDERLKIIHDFYMPDDELSDTNADVIIIDPEREDRDITKVLKGQHIVISANSKNHINAMDLNRNYGEGADPLVDKTQFIMSLCEQIMGSNAITPQHKSIVDRCTYNVYREYIRGNYTGEPPTLVDLYEELLKQPEDEANQLALALELFAKGSLNTFSKQTNIDPNNRFICYDIFELGKQLMPIGMLVILDSILNRITANREKGRRTYIFIDEIYLMFEHEYSAEFLYKLWKRARKYGACVTGITQNVEDILQSHTARTMLSNSEFVVMLNQAATDRNTKPVSKDIKGADKTIKTANHSVKKTVKSSSDTARKSYVSSKQSAKATKKSVETAKRGFQKSVKTIKATAKHTKRIVKAIIEGAEATVSAIIAGGWISVSVIIINRDALSN